MMWYTAVIEFVFSSVVNVTSPVRQRHNSGYSGINSAFFFAPMMPASRATPSTSPFSPIMVPARLQIPRAYLYGSVADAARYVSGFSWTSTMTALPSFLKWVNSAICLLRSISVFYSPGSHSSSASRTGSSALHTRGFVFLTALSSVSCRARNQNMLDPSCAAAPQVSLRPPGVLFLILVRYRTKRSAFQILLLSLFRCDPAVPDLLP